LLIIPAASLVSIYKEISGPSWIIWSCLRVGEDEEEEADEADTIYETTTSLCPSVLFVQVLIQLGDSV
jgi:hypothetical protein